MNKKMWLALAALSAGCAPTGNSSSTTADLVAGSIASGSVVTLVSKNSSKCVDVPSASRTSGTQLQQYSCNGTDAQSFTMTAGANGTYTFKNVGSGLCLDLEGDSSTNGDAIEQVTCNGAAEQSFTLAAMTGSTGTYEIKTARNSCLDITSRSTANGARLQEWSCSGNSNQQFIIEGATTTTTPPESSKLLSQLGAKCNGSDDTLATIAAITGARDHAYTLVVDCTATLDIGLNVDRAIFIDDGTTVTFQGAGKFIVNNLFEPAFVIADSQDITLTGWDVEYATSMPVSLNTDGWYLAGKYTSQPGHNGSGVFNDVVKSGWMTKNKGVVFADGPVHGKWANWLGSVNSSAIFYVVGDTQDVTITGLNLHSANVNQPSDYIPFGFEFGVDYKSNQTVTLSTPAPGSANASKYFAAPSHVTIDDATLDGVIMGFQGITSDSTFSNITVKHSSDLQDASGNNVGGIGQNFPPPHVFYLNYEFNGDPALSNANIEISNVNEVGPRLGGLRPGGGGYADSLKLGCNTCSVDGYKTNRKDGFMDVLSSSNLTVSNVVATYDSSFVDVYENWPAWRWPGGGSSPYYRNITFKNVSLTDLAATSVAAPLSNSTGNSNSNIAFDNVNITVQSWTKGNIVPTFDGIAAGSEVTFTLKKQGTTQTLK